MDALLSSRAKLSEQLTHSLVLDVARVRCSHLANGNEFHWNRFVSRTTRTLERQVVEHVSQKQFG